MRGGPQADFTNPGILGPAEEFRRKYKNPILTGREPGASQAEQDRATVLQVCKLPGGSIGCGAPL